MDKRTSDGRFAKGSKVNSGRVPSEQQKAKQSQAMKGRTLTENHIEKIRTSMLRSIDEGKAIGHPKGMSTWNKGISIDTSHLHTEEIRKKISIANTGKPCSMETRKKLSAIVREWWKNPDNARKALVFNKPNKSEMKLFDILESMYPGEWKFVGDGQVVIDGKCPDFINVNGQKKIIELYGERWHQNENPQDRIDVFKPFGYDTLVIWLRELQNSSKVKLTIKQFCESRHQEV
jgi:hypothetical protein